MTEASGPTETKMVADRLLMRRIAILASLALVFVAGCAALLLAQGVDRQLKDVQHTFDMRTAARDISIALVDAESGQLGYVLTQDESYLLPYEKTVHTIDERLLALREMATGDAEQSARVDRVAKAVQGKIAEMASTVALVANSHEALATSIVKGGGGARLMEDLRNTLNAFIAEEDKNLLMRNSAIAGTRLWITVAILAALVGAVALTYVLFNRTERQVSALTRSQNELNSQREALALRVLERTAELEESQAHAQRERERVETLLKDTNHRIGNSLATVSSLLGLQMMRSTSDEVKNALEAARLRVHAIASSHRRLRLGDDLETTRADEFLHAVLDDLESTHEGTDPVRFVQDFEDISISSRDATTLGIILGELVTNALKHAFPEGRKGTISVRLFRDEAKIATLEVSDDGMGPSEKTNLDDGGLGSVIVRQLTQQFGGKPAYEKNELGGLRVRVPLPKIAAEAPTV
ncbi:CHASE3 domain-containing protein [Devosia rhodophyticola]|uniref:histidine kinase n=1 Tax=Devosia rhodophyticola TaxID=3026423 RepID=A0ABY7YUH2_9HYPH|nr:CHASE3 domain-containing protein [Devosia rhodophyticola]WDR05000.1 CHASE3 domain-containing protein [Devosia rhodophyticola]